MQLKLSTSLFLGSLLVSGAAVAEDPLAAGKAFYEDGTTPRCASCHDRGVAGAPRLHHADDWQARSSDLAELLSSTLDGLGPMPPYRGRVEVEQIRDAVLYMVGDARDFDVEALDLDALATPPEPDEEESGAAQTSASGGSKADSRRSTAPRDQMQGRDDERAGADRAAVESRSQQKSESTGSASSQRSAPAPSDLSAEAFYRSGSSPRCASCHDRGVAGAPRPGVDADWEGRSDDVERLARSTLEGLSPMPAYQGRASAEDVRAAVRYMLNQ